MTIQEAADAISLAATWPTILIGFGVVVHWGPEAWKAFLKNRKQRTAQEWLILGIAVGFLGSVLDNGYWGLAWSSHFIDHHSETTNTLFHRGVYFNIPFRQLSGCYAGYCHLFSYFQNRKSHTLRVRMVVLCTSLLGVIYVSALALWK